MFRLHEGVNFDFQDLFLRALGGVKGCLEVVCARNEPPARRGVLRRVTLEGGEEFQFHVAQLGAASQSATSRGELLRRRQFVMDNCALQPIPAAPSRNAIRLDAPDGVMLHVSGTALHSDTLPARTAEGSALFERASHHATCHLTGASVLLDSSLSQENTMPRPSRISPNFNEPDGQEVFLGAPAVGSGRFGTHFTAVQCESQSWWFLANDSRTARARNVVLMGVSHSNGNRTDSGALTRAADWGRLPQVPNRLATPPSIVWQGTRAAEGRCVLVGCRLQDSVFLRDPGTVVDVGTVFLNDSQGEGRKLFLSSPAQISQRHPLGTPGGSYAPVDLSPLFPASNPTFDENVAHLVPVLQEDVP